MMSYCINPHCQNPQNPEVATVCQSCGANLRLKDRYRVFQTLSQGIHGRTFLAVDEDKPSQPQCVIQQFFSSEKVEGQSVASSGMRTQHITATLLEKLGKHPQLPEFLASFEQGGCLYWVQEYIDGHNLAQELADRGVYQELQIWQLLNGLLPVLQLIHDRQLIHRDIKPENIISRTPSNQQRTQWALVDLGSAIPANRGLLTRETVGSAEYAAPEQIKGRAIASSDLYSLGVVCLHLLTHLSPFDLFDIKAETWTWRHYLKVPVSDRLGRVLDKLVQRDPLKRYQSATEVLKDLKGGPLPLDKVLQQRPKWVLTTWGGAAIAVLCLIISSKLPSPVPQSSFNSSRSSQTPNLRFTPPQINDLDNYSLKETSPMRTLAYTAGPVWSVTVTPNGRMVATGTTDGTIQLLNLRSGRVMRALSGHTGPVWSVAVSPNGKILASGSADHTIKLWNLCTGREIATLSGHTAGVFSVAFSPDGKAIASVGKDKSVKLWQVDTGMELGTLNQDADEVQSIAFSPDGKTLVSGGSDGLIKLWNWQTGDLRQTIQGHSDAVWSVAISPDGQTLASGSWDNTIKLWNLNHRESHYSQGSLSRTLIGHSDKVQSLAFSPDGNTLASGDLSGTIKLWQMGSGGLMGTLKGHSSWVEVAFNPKGKMLISGSFDDTIKVWRLSP